MIFHDFLLHFLFLGGQEWEEHFGHFAKDLEQMDSSGATPDAAMGGNSS